VRYRVGAFGTVNAAIGALGFAAFVFLIGLCAAIIGSGQNVVWSVVAGIISVLVAAVMALLAAGGVGTWRSVRLTVEPDGSGSLSVPGFQLQRGFYREVIAIQDVSGVCLSYLSQPRNGRWQLVVTRRRGRPIRCDSITSSRGPNANVHGTRAWRAVADLRDRVHTAQRR